MEDINEIIRFINGIEENTLFYHLFIVLFLMLVFIVIVILGVWLNYQVNINNNTSVATKEQERGI